jgi:transcription elongation factor GreA
VANEKSSLQEVVRLFAESGASGQRSYIQEAIRFARWVGEERRISEIRAPDVEAYVTTFGANSPNASARADALKGFLSYAYKSKLMDERLVSHVRVRRTGGKARGQARGLEEKSEIRLTKEGRAALEEELEQLKERRPRIAQELRDAMADKDFRENAPLDAARESQGQVEARIREIENTLRHAIGIEEGSKDDFARVGSTVVLSNLASGAKLSYLLVSSAEARPTAGRLSVASPVGQAIVGKRAGDEIEVQAPSGRVRFRIDSVES